MSVDGARARLRDELFGALGPAGGHADGVLEAIEALIEAKRAEELDAATLFADRRSSEKVPPREAPYVPARIRQEREETSSGAYVPRPARAQGLERMLADPYSRALQPHGNEDAQTPGIDEGADSETVTADHDTIANWVVDGIEADLDDRAGLGLGGLDIEIRSDIRLSWLKVVRGALAKVMEPDGSNPPPGDDDSLRNNWGGS